MSVSAPTSFICPQCGAVFRRSEHCERHIVSHGVDRPFRCGFCPQSFKRRDVLKRHWQTCKPRLQKGLDVPNFTSKTRGKKRKACDRCVRLKRACTFEFPCKNCCDSNEHCLFESVNQVQKSQSHDNERSIVPCEDTDGFIYGPSQSIDGSESSELKKLGQLELPLMGAFNEIIQDWDFLTPFSWSVNMDMTPDLGLKPLHYSFPDIDTIEWPSRSDFDINSLSRFPFLSTFTAAANGFANSFECGTITERKDMVRELELHGNNSLQDYLLGRNEDTAENLSTLASPEHFSMDTNQTWSTLRWDYGNAKASPDAYDPLRSSFQCDEILSSWPINKLDIKSEEILNELKMVIVSKSRSSKITMNWSPPLEDMCRHFFSAGNLKRLLALYWAFWSPNCPIIHKPTFSISATSSTLLTTMALVGACLSPDPADQAGAKVWLNSAEEMIFCGSELFDEPSLWFHDFGPDVANNQPSLEILQAAYLLCLTQNWEGSQESKRRIRRQRYSAVVAFARDFGLSNATLKYVSSEDMRVFIWDHFILQESLIRTLIYVFLLDDAFAIFNNLPPRMVVPELRMDLASPELCFQAESPEECFVHLNSWQSSHPARRRYLNVSEAIEMLCQAAMSAENRERLSNLSILNMFVLVSGLHSSTFHIQTALILTADVSPINAGINNWKQLWLSRLPPISLATESPDYFWKRPGFMQHAPEFWLLVKVMLERLSHSQTTSARTRAGLPMKYDEADMSQVNALITGLQNINLMM